MLKLKQMSPTKDGYIDYYINNTNVGWYYDDKFSGYRLITPIKQVFIYHSIFYVMITRRK